MVRFVAPETGGVLSPQFIFERTLAFEARLEALADGDTGSDPARPFQERHVRAALERHIAETLLASLRLEPEPSARQLDLQSRAARLLLVERVGGESRLRNAAEAEGLGEFEVSRIARRQARASLYLDRMVAPMLHPNDAELKLVQQETPYRDQPFATVRTELRRWFVARRLAAALATFYQGARARLQIVILTGR